MGSALLPLRRALAPLLLVVALLAAVDTAAAAERAQDERTVQRTTSRQAQCTTTRLVRIRASRSRAVAGGARIAKGAASACANALPVVTSRRDPASARSITLGANVRGWRDGGAIDDRLATAASDGTRTTRVDVSWSDEEPQPGRYAREAYDARFRALARAGMRAVVVLDGTPSWAGAESDYAADPAGFARFTARTVARYGAGGSFWAENPGLDGRLAPIWFELWNEPYFSSSSANRRDPAAYGRLVKAAATAGRAANPRVKYLLAGDTVVYDDVRGRWRDWFTAVFGDTPGLLRVVDGIALHPYFRGGAADYDPRSSRFQGQFLRLDAIRDQLRRVGAGKLPWFVTEVGSATCRDRSSNAFCTTERGQAANFRGALALLRTRYAANVRAVLAYRAEDLDYGGAGGDQDALGSFGMRRLDGSAKPVLDDYRRALQAG